MAFSGYVKNEPDYHEDLLLDVIGGNDTLASFTVIGVRC